MRLIIGKDYYDGAGLGVDPTVVFVRQERAVDPEGLPHGLTAVGGARCLSYLLEGALGLAVVAGRAYPWVRLPADPLLINPDRTAGQRVGSLWALAGQDSAGVVLHSFEKAHAQAEALVERWAEGLTRRDASYGRRWVKPALERHFKARGDEQVMAWAVERRAVTALVAPNPERRPGGQAVLARADGAFLHEVALWHVLAPSEAHQMIAGFVGGILPGNERPMVEMDDGERLVKAGMDPVTSFRNPPQGRKKKPGTPS